MRGAAEEVEVAGSIRWCVADNVSTADLVDDFELAFRLGGLRGMENPDGHGDNAKRNNKPANEFPNHRI